MSALAELERYIKANETTLYSINQQKLTRNSFSQRNDSSLLHSNQSVLSVHRPVHNESSVENELNNFITRLQQMQQFRLSQLQQVNALFALDMDIEDQFDLNVITVEEQNQQTAEEEFEAFLLGDNKEPKDAMPPPFVPPPPQSTLFSKHALAQPTKKPTKATSTSSSSGDESNSESNESKSQVPDDAVGFTDDVIIQLKKNRLDRSNRLRTIAKSIQSMGLTNTANNSSNAENHTLSRSHKEILDMSAVSRSAEDSLHSLRRDVLNTSNIKHAVYELPPPPPPPLGSASYAQSLAPPPAGGVSYAGNSEVPRVASHAQAPTQAQPVLSSAAITLQSILDDEQFDVSAAIPALGAVSYVTSGTLFSDANTHTESTIQLKHSNAAKSQPKSTTSAAPPAAPFLVSNARRRAFEQGLAAEADEQDNLSISTIHSHPQSTHAHSNPYSNNKSAAQRHHKPTTAPSQHHTKDHIVGIGFGERYGHDGETAGAEEAGEISSIGSHDSADSSGHSGHSGSGHRHLSSMRRSGNKLFEYADQLESPVKKKPTASVSFAADGAGADSYGSSANKVNESVQKAAQFTHHVSDYYNRRIQSLEAAGGYAGSPKNVSARTSASSINVVDVTSPERPARRASASGAYDSPTPKTPTFAPIFS